MDSIKYLQEVDIFRLSGCNKVYLCLFVFSNVVIFEESVTGDVYIWDRDIDFLEVEVLLRSF